MRLHCFVALNLAPQRRRPTAPLSLCACARPGAATSAAIRAGRVTSYVSIRRASELIQTDYRSAAAAARSPALQIRRRVGAAAASDRRVFILMVKRRFVCQIQPSDTALLCAQLLWVIIADPRDGSAYFVHCPCVVHVDVSWTHAEMDRLGF